MSRRSVALVLTFGLFLTSLGIAAFTQVSYVRFSPGPTVDVLGTIDGTEDGDRIVQIDGAETYPTDGQLRMTTVSTTRAGQRISLLDALMAWADPSRGLYDYDTIYPDNTTAEEEEAESQVEMVSSQDSAIAAALRELDYDFEERAAVLQVSPDGAAAGNLKARDVFVAINGREISRTDQVARIISGLPVGSDVTIDVLRAGKPLSFDLRTRASTPDPSNPEDRERSVIGIIVGGGFDFPIDVTVAIPEQIGGPSAGLIFALSIYDTLTPGDLTGGLEIAGTGTISSEGVVGPIGGIEQKISGAGSDGATVFLVPPDNCSMAVTVDTDMTLVRADSLESAIDSLEALADDPDADVPSCEDPT